MTHRIEKIESTLARAIQQVISQGLHDPRAGGLISVLRVNVAQDMANATAFVSVYPEEKAELTEWASWRQPRDEGETRLLAHPGSSAGVGRLTQPTRIAIGPEGGFTDAEAELAGVHGWQLVGLGPRILRVETAAVALVALATRV